MLRVTRAHSELLASAILPPSPVPISQPSIKLGHARKSNQIVLPPAEKLAPKALLRSFSSVGFCRENDLSKKHQRPDFRLMCRNKRCSACPSRLLDTRPPILTKTAPAPLRITSTLLLVKESPILWMMIGMSSTTQPLLSRHGQVSGGVVHSRVPTLSLPLANGGTINDTTAEEKGTYRNGPNMESGRP